MSIKIISCALCGCDFEKTGRVDKYCINCRAIAKKIIKNLLDVAKFYNKHRDKGAIMDITPIYDAEQFLKEADE